MTDFTSRALADSVKWTKKQRDDVLKENFTLFSASILQIREALGSVAPDPNMVGRGRTASILEQFESAE